MSVHVGVVLDGRYRMEERLAYGGMGEVWRGTDQVLGRSVAVKILRPELATDDSFRRRFRAEARTTGGLPHPGIAAVFDYGETTVGIDGSSPASPDQHPSLVAYLVMELVPGEALSTILARDGALGSERTLDLVAQAARGLHAAHQRGVIHRDVKPANLMVTPEGRVKVTDFGIARPRDHEPLTATGQVMGTAHYLAPELARGQEASALSDVYALGVVAYECLAGRRPFEGDNQVAVALAHLNEEPPPLPETIPAQVRSVVAAAMEKDQTRRMPGAEAFAAALDALRTQVGAGGAPPTPDTGVLPGSAAAIGLAAAGLYSDQRATVVGAPAVIDPTATSGRLGTMLGPPGPVGTGGPTPVPAGTGSTGRPLLTGGHPTRDTLPTVRPDRDAAVSGPHRLPGVDDRDSGVRQLPVRPLAAGLGAAALLGGAALFAWTLLSQHGGATGSPPTPTPVRASAPVTVPTAQSPTGRSYPGESWRRQAPVATERSHTASASPSPTGSPSASASAASSATPSGDGDSPDPSVGDTSTPGKSPTGVAGGSTATTNVSPAAP